MVDSTIGCRRCKDKDDEDEEYKDYELGEPVVNYHEVFGTNVYTCLNYTQLADYPNQDGVPCEPGKITQWVGVIEDDKELICTDCAEIIPNCLSCSSNSTCDLCNSGYQNVQLYDAFGNEN